MGRVETTAEDLTRVPLRHAMIVLALLLFCISLLVTEIIAHLHVGGKASQLGLAIELILVLVVVVLAAAVGHWVVRYRNAWAEEKADAEMVRPTDGEFRGPASSGPVLTRVTDKVGSTTFANTAWLTFTGRSMAAVTGEGWLQSVHAEDRSKCQQALADLLQTRVPSSIDYRLRRHDGVYRWMHDRTTARFNTSDTFLGSMSTCVDITEQHEKEMRVREINDALEHALEGISMLDKNFCFSSVNSAFASALGCEPEQLIGQPLAQFVAAEDGTILQNALKEKGKVGKSECELRGRRKDGSTFFQRLTFLSRDCAATGILGCFCFMKDITDHRSALTFASELSTRFDSLASIAPIGVFHTDAVGNCLYVNGQWCRLAGMSQQEAAGNGWKRAIHPDDRDWVTNEWTESVQAGNEFRAEYRFQTPAGQISHLLGASSPVKNAAGKTIGYVGVITDITQSKQSRDDLFSSLQKQLELLEREKFLRRELDHRVRNNLASLIGLVSLYEHTDRSTRELAQTLRGQIAAMKQVHETISRAGGGDVCLQPLFKILHQSIVPQDAMDRVTLHGPAIEVSAPKAAALAMIVQELVTNSLKHGALTSLIGTISLKWNVRQQNLNNTQKTTLEIEWIEIGVPESSSDSRPNSGVGIGLIEGLAQTDLGGSVRFERSDSQWHCYLIAELNKH